MQKLIRRTERAQRVVARQTQKTRDHKLKGESWERNQARLRVVKEQNERIRQARRNRHEDWEAGPLAPRRDVGEQVKTYGSVQIYNVNLPDKDPEQRPNWTHVQAGDRAVILRGRDRGRIGVIEDVSLEKGAVRLQNLNQMDVNIPDWMRQEQDLDRNVVTAPQYMPLEDVKLVYPLPDPVTGIPRDVIIDRLTCANRRWDKNKKKWDDGDRVIPGTNTIIPWPEKADPVYEDHEDDTLRISVEEQTFRPFLIRPPMPLSVIDELRYKYSRFRTRHDDDYRVRKEAEDAKAGDRERLIQTMRTPRQELAALRALQKKKEQEKDLTPEQLAKIGEVIAQEQAKTVGHANVS